jgi:hypothetical protein
MKALLTCAVLAALALAACAAAATSALPALQLVQQQPPVVSGSHFRHAERVTVTFGVGGQRFVRIVRATRTGTFSASAAAGVLDRCGDQLLVVAVGRLGSRATVKLQLPLCPPAP